MKPRSFAPTVTTMFAASLINIGFFLSAATNAAGESVEFKKAADADTYELFTGLDLSAEHEGKLRHVVDVTGENFFLKRERDVEKVPFWKVKSYRMDPTLKLSDTVVEVTNFKAIRTYTHDADPRVKWNRSQNVLFMNSVDTMSDRATNIRLTPNKLPEKGAISGETLQATAVRKFETQVQQDQRGPGDRNNPGWFADRMQGELNDELYDAIQLDFTVTSQKFVEDPYLVIITTGRDPNQPDKEFTTIFAKSLQSIGNAQPKDFHIVQGGMPPGYKLENTHFHLYSRKQELATTLSEKRLSLTKAEAIEYLITQYELDHKTETLPPKAALTPFPSNFSEEIKPEQAGKRFTLTIDPKGNVKRVAASEDARDDVDPYVEKLLKSFTFFPALLKGKPVEGQLRARFADL